MFLEKEELPSVIYGYQLEQITEGNDNIVLQAIGAAIEEVRSYLTINNKKEWIDGRLIYDVEKVFEAQGLERNTLILEVTKTVTVWWVVRLCNADIIYEQTKERYDRTIDWLTKLSKGIVNLSTLPQVDFDQSDQNRQPFSFGSQTKFTHDID